jgi:bifunctional non-homologous end joining protein LigD
MTDTDGPAIDPDAHVNFDAPASLRKWASLNNQRRTEGGGPQAIVYNEHITHNGPTLFEHACRLGLEGIVSKRWTRRRGPSVAWLKSLKNPLSEAVRREREEDWS